MSREVPHTVLFPPLTRQQEWWTNDDFGTCTVTGMTQTLAEWKQTSFVVQAPLQYFTETKHAELPYLRCLNLAKCSLSPGSHTSLLAWTKQVGQYSTLSSLICSPDAPLDLRKRRAPNWFILSVDTPVTPRGKKIDMNIDSRAPANSTGCNISASFKAWDMFCWGPSEMPHLLVNWLSSSLSIWSW